MDVAQAIETDGARPEWLNAFAPNGKLVIVEERKRLIARIREQSTRDGDANLAVQSIYVMLCNSDGQLYIVQRSDKEENPFLWDKSVGGHVSSGETYSAALCREVEEEIGVRVILTDFERYPVDVERFDTKRFAVVRPIDFAPWLRSLRAVREGTPWVKRHRSMIYAGRFNGTVAFKDGEAMKCRLMHRQDLEAAIREEPEKFTYDLPAILERYGAFLW